MNRKLLLAAIVLLVLLGFKYAVGQDEGGGGVGWEPITVYPPPDTCIFGVMKLAPVLGVIIGIVKVLTQNSRRQILEPLRLK